LKNLGKISNQIKALLFLRRFEKSGENFFGIFEAI
jgi:hypothetical protein